MGAAGMQRHREREARSQARPGQEEWKQRGAGTSERRACVLFCPFSSPECQDLGARSLKDSTHLLLGENQRLLGTRSRKILAEKLRPGGGLVKDQGEQAEAGHQTRPGSRVAQRARKQHPPVPHRYCRLSYPPVLAFSSHLVKPHTRG